MPLDGEGLAEAAEILRGILAEVGERDTPPLPDAEDTWLRNVAAVTDEIESLDVSGWLCVVAALTIWGPRTDADPVALATYVAETEGGDAGELAKAFVPVVERWHALEVIDDVGRLTKLGWWGLPEAFIRAWS